MALAIGMLVGFERESASKDVGIRTFGLTALLGAIAVLISPAYGLAAMWLSSSLWLGLIGLVIYPILPDRFVDRWQLVNLRQAWITVVVIAGVAFVNYVLLRLYGHRGLVWTAVLGGLENNRAAIAELMRLA